MRTSILAFALLMTAITIASALVPFADVRPGAAAVGSMPGDGCLGTAAPRSAPAADGIEGGALAQLRSSFTENAGQLADGGVLYYAASDGIQAGFGTGFVLLALRSSGGDGGAAVRVTFPGSNAVTPVGRGELGHRSSFLLGSDPSAWRTGVRSYREVAYEGLYDGIDLVYRAGAGGLKYDVVVRPGADPGQVEMAIEGVEGLALGGDGAIRIRTAAGALGDAAPTALTQGGDAVPCAYELRGPRSYGFVCGQWDASQTLVIDPMVYATFVGGGGSDEIRAVALDASGCAYVTGLTHSTDLPHSLGAFQDTAGGSGDAFVAKLAADGSSLVYATYIGGSQLDEAGAICLGSPGYAFIAGRTYSDDFPVTAGAYQTTKVGSSFFVAKLDLYGTDLLYSTFLGSGTYEATYAYVGVDSLGSAYVAGATTASDFPVTAGAFQTAYGGNASDAFVAKLNPTGSALAYSTFLGGGATDRVGAITVDASGRACVVGATNSTDFPTTAGALGTSFQGGEGDAFVALLGSDGASLAYSTYLGGGRSDRANAVVVDPSGHAYVAGSTDSMDFPVTGGAYKTGNNGLSDGFVAKLGPTGGSLVYATYFGTNDNDFALGLDVDGVGNATIVGGTDSASLPVTANAVQSDLGGGMDPFMAELDSSGGSLVYVTYLGGSAYDIACGVALGDGDDVAVVGYTGSTDLPVTSGAAQTSYGGGTYDGFVAMLSTAQPPAQYRVDFDTSPSGLLVTIDGSDRTTPTWEMWDAGSYHEVSAPTPQQTGFSARAEFMEWSDGGALTHEVLADGPKALTASFTTQYLVSFETSPWRLDVTVDAMDRSTPYTEWWGEGTSHTVSAPSPQQSGSDTQYLFDSWSDGGAMVHSILVEGPMSVTATFLTQHRVTVETSPVGLGVQVDGVDRATPYSEWWDSGAAHTISAPSPQAAGQSSRYDFDHWSDYGAQSHDVSVWGPETYTAFYSAQYLVRVATDPAGFGVRVDGSWATSPVELWLAEGTHHTLYVNYTEDGGNYYFGSWSDGGSISHSWTVDGPSNITATFEMPAPMLAVVDPAPGERARGDLLFSGSAGAGATIQLRVDGGDWTNVTTVAPGGLWSYEWDSRSVANGDHTVEVKAVRAGKESPEVSRDVTVWNPGPPGFMSGLGIVYVINAIVLLIVLVVLLLLVVPWRMRAS